MKVTLHAHSTWSYDGQWELPAIARLFGRLGVDAVMMTEHDTGFSPDRFDEYRAACAAASTPSCTLVPGIEYSSPDNDIHMLTWGLEHFLSEHRPVMETLEAVTALGGVAVFAHPVRRDAFAQFDPAWVPHLAGIELWNRKSDGLTWGREAAALLHNTGLPATLGCDFHRLKHLYGLSHKVDVTGPTEPALIKALKAGALKPQIFGRPLTLSPTPQTPLHDRLERLRKGVVKRLRG